MGAESKSTMNVVLDSLHSEIAYLEDAVVRLSGRLLPVLEPEKSSGEQDALGSGAVPMPVHVTGVVGIAQSRIASLSATVENMLDRLHL